MEVGGLSCFLMIPGYSHETAKEVYLQHQISMNTGGDSDDDFRRLLGEGHIVGPKNEAEGLVMLKGISDILVRLADGSCIASSGYALAAELWAENERHIFKLARHSQEPYFLLRLLCRIDMENRILLEDLFDDILATGPGVYKLFMRGMNRRDEKIHQVFEGFRRGITTGMDLPQNFLSLMGPQQ